MKKIWFILDSAMKIFLKITTLIISKIQNDTRELAGCTYRWKRVQCASVISARFRIISIRRPASPAAPAAINTAPRSVRPPKPTPVLPPGSRPRRNLWKPRKTRPYSSPSQGPNSTPARPFREFWADRGLIAGATWARFLCGSKRVRLGVVVGCYGPVCGCSGPFPLGVRS